MNDLYLQACPKHTREGLERVRYFPRMLVTVDDMETEHAYFREKLRRHNRYLHGWGVVCGLEVTAAPGEGSPWCVRISEGYALGPFGDEIYVSAPGVDLDLEKCGPDAATDPCEPGAFSRMTITSGGEEVYVAIKFAECLSDPVRAMPPGCGCEEELCEYSRIRDSFEIGCLTELPRRPKVFSLCDFLNGSRLPVCLPCPTGPWVVLARVTLPRSQAETMGDSSIDNFVRQQIFSNAVLQATLEMCCCKKQPQQISKADLVVKFLDAIAVNRTRSVDYKFKVSNVGGAVATAVKVTSTIKGTNGNIKKASGFSATAGTWETKLGSGPFLANLGDMKSGDDALLTFKVTMDQTTTSVKNELKASTETAEENPENDTDEVTTEFVRID